MNNHLKNHAEDPHLQRIRRKLVRLMLGSIIITFVLVGLVLAAVIYKIMQTSDPSPNLAASMQMPVEQQLDLTDGDSIVSYSLSGDVIALWNRSSSMTDQGMFMTNEFIFYDYRQGQILSRLKLNTAYSPTQ